MLADVSSALVWIPPAVHRLCLVLLLALTPCAALAEQSPAAPAPHEEALERARALLVACAENRSVDPAAKSGAHYWAEEHAFAWLALKATGWVPTRRARTIAEYSMPLREDASSHHSRYVAARMLLADLAPEVPVSPRWLEQLGSLRISRVAWRLWQGANIRSLGATLWASLALHARAGDSALAQELRTWQMERYASTQLRTGGWSMESLSDPQPSVAPRRAEEESLIASLYVAAQVGLAQGTPGAPAVRTLPVRRLAGFARQRLSAGSPGHLLEAMAGNRWNLDDALAYVVVMRTQGRADHTWFPALAKRLVETQKADGSWGTTREPGRPDIVSTAMGVLLLARPSGVVLPAARGP